MAIDFRDHLTTLQTGIVCRAAGRDLFDNRTVNVFASLQLLPELRSQVGEANTPARLALAGVGTFASVLASCHRLQRYRHIHRFAITQGFELECGSWLLLSDLDL